MKFMFKTREIWRKSPRHLIHNIRSSFFYSTNINSTKLDIKKTNNNTCAGEEIVITGISGRFPQSENVEEFKQNLYNKVDMVTTQDRFKSHKIPTRFGFLKNLDKFDAGFFGIVPKLAHFMDPQHRKLLEVSFEAILDSGINPDELKGSKTGVYVGGFGSESLEYWILASSIESMDGYSAIAVSNFALANRVSFSFDFTGPSMVISTGCSASLVALETAVQAIKLGICENAIVAGSAVQLSPAAAIDFGNMNALALDGRCKTFDKDADGFVRAEAIVAMLIQRKKAAKRAYATIKTIKSNSDGYKQVGLMYPSGKSQEKLLRTIYGDDKSQIDPNQVSYIEAHGTGTPVGDPEELTALYNVMCKDKKREEPLLLGSVKSNMGHGESAAGLCSLTKMIIGIGEKSIPPNLHFKEPMPKFKHMFDEPSFMKVVTESTPFEKGYVGISSFGIGGTNAHVVLEPNWKQNESSDSSLDLDSHPSPSQNQNHTRKLPIIIPFSGRTKENVQEALNKTKIHCQNPEYVGLLHNIFSKNVRGHPIRGYSIQDPNPVKNPEENKIVVNTNEREMDTERPIFFVFPGMGSQWNEMGKDLMKIDAFAHSLQNSRAILKNLGIDLDQLLAKSNRSIFGDIRDAFASIFSIQMALYDTLKSVGITPSGFLGHSSGEILCAYADGCFTAEEALMIGDARGRAMRSPYPGAMASVGLSWNDLLEKCPPDRHIYPACHNSANNVTISGSQKSVREFVTDLNDQGIFAKEVNSCNYAAHSPLPVVVGASEKFLEYLQEFKLEEKERSSKWISTSIPETEWESPSSKLNSALYHSNNIKNPVLFHQAVQKIPNNALVLEIAPHGMFQAILKESLSPKNVVIAPMSSKVEDKVLFFLNSLGKIYNCGVNVNFSSLYPPVSFPVSASTPGLSSLIKWNHEESWTVPIIENPSKMGLDGVTKKVDLSGKSGRFLEGHRLDNRIVYPATGYLVLAWETYAESLGLDYKNCSVSFTNLSFERATYLNEDNPTYFLFNVLDGSGNFEITEGGATVVRGNIQVPEDIHKKMFRSTMITKETGETVENIEDILTTADVYKELKLRGYNYSGDFKGIRKIDIKGRSSEVNWRGNWVAFLDSVLQTLLLATPTRLTAIPVRFEQVNINPNALVDYVESKKGQLEKNASSTTSSSPKPTDSSPGETDDPTIPVHINETLKAIQCPGVEFRGLTAMVIPRKRQKELLSVEEYIFTPYFDQKVTELEREKHKSSSEVVAGLIDLILENLPGRKIKIMDVFETAEKSLIEPIYKGMITKPGYNMNLSMVSSASEIEKLDGKILNYGEAIKLNSMAELTVDPSADLIFVDESVSLSNDIDKMIDIGKITNPLKDGAYVVVHSQNSDLESRLLNPENLTCISIKCSKNAQFSLFQKRISTVDLSSTCIKPIFVDGPLENWLPELQSAMAGFSSPTSAPTALSTKTEDKARVTNKTRIYLTSQNAPTSGVIGLVKCLKKEAGGENIRCIFDPEGHLIDLNFEKPSDLLKGIISRDLVMNVFKNGEHGSYRHFPLLKDTPIPLKDGEQAYVTTMTPGDLSSLRWVKSPLSTFNPILRTPVDKVVNVCYAAMNFRDIMLASGRLPIDPSSLFAEHVMGIEYSGIDHKGQKVMGFPMSNSLATACLGNSELTWTIPENWSLEEAATVPIAYATAYYALFNRGRLAPGQSILIHSGTGGVGQAAINLALSKNCRIFTTVGTEEKHQFIKKLFPALKDENIGHSRDCSFEQQILELTDGEGVEVVLNSLADDKLHASLRCLAPNGKFLEIGELDMFKNTMMGLGTFMKNVEFHGVLMAHVLSVPEGRKYVKDVIDEGLKNGVVKPLPRTVFQPEQIEEAFRFMARGKHMGKVLIKVQDENSTGVSRNIQAIPKTYFNPQKIYIVVGGLGGLGLEVADFLVEKGANHLILVSRSGVTTGYQRLCLKKWAEKGVTVETSQLDLSSFQKASEFLHDLSKRGKIGGIFNSSLVLKDGLIENQTPEMFEVACAPKILITQNLDILSRIYCTELDYFVAFSSMACGRGNAGQSNYGYGNSAIERMCEQRKKDGLHGLAIQWGVIGEVGFVAEKLSLEGSRKKAGNADEIFDGTAAQRIQSCLEVLDFALQQTSSPIISSMVIADKDKIKSQRAGILSTFTSAFGIKDVATIPENTKLVDLGMDSLIGIELKQALERDYDIALTPGEMRQLTFGDLIAVDAGTYVKGASDRKNSGPRPITKSIVQLKSHEKKDGKGKEAGIPLFMIHGTDGHTTLLEPLAAKLPVDSYAFHLFEGQKMESVKEMASFYIQEMKQVQPKGPYNICGYSSGAVIAFEMVTQLNQNFKEEVSNLIILDGCFGWKPDELNSKAISQHWFDSFGDSEMKIPYLKRLSNDDEENIRVCVEFAKQKLMLSTKEDEIRMEEFLRKKMKYMQMIHSHQPSTTYKYDGNIFLIKAKQVSTIYSQIKDKETYNVRDYCNGSLQVYTVDGHHESFLRPQMVQPTVDILQEIWKKSEESQDSGSESESESEPEPEMTREVLSG